MKDIEFNNGMEPVHPGEILKEEFLEPMDMTANHLADILKVTPARVYEIIACKRGITADTALRLSFALDTSPIFWMNLQSSYDLKKSFTLIGEKLSKEIIQIEREK